MCLAFLFQCGKFLILRKDEKDLSLVTGFISNLSRTSHTIYITSIIHNYVYKASVGLTFLTQLLRFIFPLLINDLCSPFSLLLYTLEFLLLRCSL